MPVYPTTRAGAQTSSHSRLAARDILSRSSALSLNLNLFHSRYHNNALHFLTKTSIFVRILK